MGSTEVQNLVSGVKRMDKEKGHGCMNVKPHRHRILLECYRGDVSNVRGRQAQGVVGMCMEASITWRKLRDLITWTK